MHEATFFANQLENALEETFKPFVQVMLPTNWKQRKEI